MKKYIILGCCLLVLLIAAGTGCSQYNSMVTQSVNVDKAWAQVQTQYQRRADLIPNLVATVKGYAKHEKGTLTEVTAMRAGGVTKAGDELLAANAAAATPNGPDATLPSPEKLQQVDRALSVYVNAVREAYPQLMANENFMDLQKQLEGTENRIATERGRYNDAVQEYNLQVQRFPANIFAGMFGFHKKQMFMADNNAQSAPQVSFDDQE